MENQEQQQIPFEQLPFDVKLFTKADALCTDALATIPELHGIAVIPLWIRQPENTPSGILRFRNPQMPYVDGLLALMKRVAAFQTDALGDSIKQLRMIESYHERLQSEIKQLQEQQAELRQNETTQ